MTPKPITRFAHAIALAALLAGCAGGHPQLLDPDFDFGDVVSYAWKEAPRFDGGMAEGEDDELRDLERRVERDLERRGIRLVAKERAQIVLSGTITVETRERPLDPNYSVYASEQYEVATITLEVYQRAARKLVWADQETLPLRTVARRFGRRLVEDWSETGDERRWRVDEMVDALVGRLPE